MRSLPPPPGELDHPSLPTMQPEVGGFQGRGGGGILTALCSMCFFSMFCFSSQVTLHKSFSSSAANITGSKGSGVARHIVLNFFQLCCIVCWLSGAETDSD